MLRRISIILIVLISSTSVAEASQKPNPTVTTRDSRGVKTGTATQNNDGTTTLRDSRGVKTGKIEAPRPTKNCRDVRNAKGIKVGSVCG
jgi:hypothetical protein